MRKIANISNFEGLQAVAHARMGIGSPLSVFNADINDEGPLNSSNVIIPEDVLAGIAEFAQDARTAFIDFADDDPALISAGKRLGAAMTKQFGPGWKTDAALVENIRLALADKAGSLAKTWAKNWLLADQVESTFSPLNADYAQHRGDLDYIDVDALDSSFDLSDDAQLGEAIRKAGNPLMKFSEAAAHEKIKQPTADEIADSAEQVYDAVLSAAMN